MRPNIEYHAVQVSTISLIILFIAHDHDTLHSYYYPHSRSPAWHNLPDLLPELSAPNPNYLPTGTVKMTYPFAFTKSACPVTAKTTAAWTEKERLKAKEAPKMMTIDELKAYVRV
jgi:hypothetical protein